MTTDRECLACEGTGRHSFGPRSSYCVKYRRTHHDWSRTLRGDDRQTFTCGCGESKGWSLCPACLGTGLQTDRITAQDAICDAETLLAAFWDEGGGAEWTDAPRGMLVNALRASDYGEAAIGEMAPAGRIQVVYAHAAMAGRYIFRAVPALREE